MIFAVTLLLLAAPSLSPEQMSCAKAVNCNIFDVEQFVTCSKCVDMTYRKYCDSVPFTKKQVFDYIESLSCQELKKGIQYYDIDRCIRFYYRKSR